MDAQNNSQNSSDAVKGANKIGFTKHTPKTETRLLKAIADGLTIGQACQVAGIGRSTYADWKKAYPALCEKLEVAREEAREKALAVIKAASDAGDVRAAELFLKYSFFPQYNQNHNTAVQVNTSTQIGLPIVTEEQR